MHIDQAVIRDFLDRAKQLLMLAEAGSKLTTTDIDDKIVEYLKKVYAAVELNNTQPYMATLIDMFMHMFEGTPQEVQDKMKAVADAIEKK